MARIKLQGCRCERCGHEWAPRTPGVEPKVCPKCHSPYWNTPKKPIASRKQGAS